MRRVATRPRPAWQRRVEEVGLIFHHIDEHPYWDESAYYRFDPEEIDAIESATNELHEMCLRAAQHIIDHDLFHELAIPDAVASIIAQAWQEEPPALYGRFDLAYDGKNLKLLEYNADTPTSLLEAAVVQWHWLQESYPRLDQFNSIHEKLLAKWCELKPYLSRRVHFTYLRPDDAEQSEDLMTAAYLMDLAQQAGCATTLLAIEEIGWDAHRRCFVDLDNIPIRSIFKLYPWEWMIRDSFAPQLLETYGTTQWIEPIWKMLLSNKGILPILWKLFPGHPNLLEAYCDGPHGMREFVRKPFLSREGANVSLQRRERSTDTPGPYGSEGYVFQALASIPDLDGNYPVLGSWVIDGAAAGIGIRESSTPITDNRSRFVPHLFG